MTLDESLGLLEPGHLPPMKSMMVALPHGHLPGASEACVEKHAELLEPVKEAMLLTAELLRWSVGISQPPFLPGLTRKGNVP